MRRFWLFASSPLPRVSPLLVASVSALAFVVPAALDAGTASAAPSPGYTARYIPAGTGVPVSVAVNPVTNTVYLGDSADQLIVVDGANNSVVATLTLPGEPRGIAVDTATDTVYVSVASSTSEVAVINGTTVSTTIPLPTGASPAGIAVDSTRDQIYVANEISGGGVILIDGKSNTVAATISSGAGEPFSLAVDESTGLVWVANLSGGVAAINEASDAITYNVTVAGDPESVAVNPVTDTVYVASEAGGGGLTVIDGADGLITATVAVGLTNNVAVDPTTDVVFVRGLKPGTNVGGTVVIDGTDNAVVNVIGRTGNFSAVDSATDSVYVTASSYAPGLWAITPSVSDGMSPLILNSLAATFTVGTAGTFTVNASALPAPTFSESGPLPAGVTLSSSGTLSGTPAAGTGGVYPITITASNGIAPANSKAFTLTVDEAPTLTVPAAVTLPVGVPVSVPFQVTGYPAPGVVNETALPGGVAVTQLASGSWELSGTPAPGSGGVYQIEFLAGNIAGGATATMTITVPVAPSITSAATATFGSAAGNLYVVTAACAPACKFSGTGTPSGLTLDSSGRLTGDPTAGTYTFTITASNSVGTATQAFTLTVTQSVAVGGDGGVLYAYTPESGLPESWSNLGGVIIAAPAVVALPTAGAATPVTPLFIATGSDESLWMQSLSAGMTTSGWQPLGAGRCIGGPAAVITGSTLTVACRGTDNALWYTTATVPSSGLPAFAGPWTNLGGILSAGPAVAPVGGTVTFFVRGTNGAIYTRTVSAGYTQTSWDCIGSPAAAQDATDGLTTFACQGTDRALWEATNPGTGWSPAGSLGGVLIGGPGIAAAQGTTEFFAEGTDESAWAWAAASGWTNLEGYTQDGVGAVALN